MASFGKYQLDSHPEKARDHYYHDYDADDVEDVHCHAPGELVITLVRTELQCWTPRRVPLLSYERADGMINAIDPERTRTERSDIGSDEWRDHCHR
jgi:hypothetical protein